MEFRAVERASGSPFAMTARALCNTVHGLLVSAHGPEGANEILYPLPIQTVQAERAMAMLDLGGELA